MKGTGTRVVMLFVAYAAAGAGGDRVVGLRAGDGVEAGVARRAEAPPAPGASCSHEAERRVALALDGASGLRLVAGSGSLRVRGVEGSGEIRAVGRACATRAEDLEHLRLELERRGDRLELVTRGPRSSRDGETARIDLEVELPLGLTTEIEDGSGAMDVSGTGPLRVHDGSGGIVVRSVLGEVTVDDGSGGILVADVDGDVGLDDGSGELEVRGVTGSVRLRDGSGSVDVRDVSGGVTVERDGSGSIDVARVGGDLSVLADGSGSVRHRGVEGRVDVPRRHRGG